MFRKSYRVYKALGKSFANLRLFLTELKTVVEEKKNYNENQKKNSTPKLNKKFPKNDWTILGSKVVNGDGGGEKKK